MNPWVWVKDHDVFAGSPSAASLLGMVAPSNRNVLAIGTGLALIGTVAVLALPARTGAAVGG